MSSDERGGEESLAAARRFGPPAHVDPVANYDTLWRKQPQVPGFMQIARQIPGYAAQFSGRVPPEFTAQVELDVIEVACPCGETPRLRWNVPEPCPCGRVFVDLGGDVHVAYTQIDEAA